MSKINGISNKIVLIGTGAWGKNYITTIHRDFPNILLQVANRHNWKNLVDEHPDGVIVATPPESHIELAYYSLSRGIPTVIEKPLSFSLSEVETLKQFNSLIIVNHIHIFSEQYQELKTLHPIKYILSFGGNIGPIRNYSSLWDYGSHDISMILDIFKIEPKNIEITNYSGKLEKSENFILSMDFGNFKSLSCFGNGFNNKRRDLYIFQDNFKYAYYDGLVQTKLPLNSMLEVFENLINGKFDNRAGLDLSLKVIKILNKCQEQLSRKE